jgi:hypothetical protein
MPVVVIGGKLPFTLTIDTDNNEITEYLVDHNSYELDENWVETRIDGTPIKDKDILAKAVEIAQNEEWPSEEWM